MTELPHDLAAIVDPAGPSVRGVGDIEGGEGIRRGVGGREATVQTAYREQGEEQMESHGDPSLG